MFTKTTLFKFALVPLAAATVLSDSASATPATQLEVRGDAPDPSGGGKWSNKANCECAWDKDHVPEIVKPCKETVWRVGERQKVVWEKKGDDDWKHDEPKKHNGTDGKDWGYGEDEDKDKDGKDWDDGKDHKRRPCKTRLFPCRAVILAENFDVKAGFVEVTVPNVFHGEDYALTVVLARDDRPELESCSDKFKIVKDEKYWHKDCKDECKPEDGKDKDGKDGGY